MLDAVIDVLTSYYQEYCKDRPLDYTYGYMDALAVIREMSLCVDLTDFAHPARYD